jgi:hypothetical protein
MAKNQAEESLNRVGLVIPTINSRPSLLPVSYASAATALPRENLIVSCSRDRMEEVAELLPKGSAVMVGLNETHLASKITAALSSLPSRVKYIGWLGDDDLLHPETIEAAVAVLDADPEVVMVFGACDYVGPSGEKIGRNKSGQWAEKILGFGPDLIPQPGSLWRRDAFERVGGLSSEFELAFDYDLFLKLRGEGKLVYVPQTLASFRWHPDSLSVRKRWTSALEASRVRRKHYRGAMRALWPLWEPLIIGLTWFAGKLVSLMAAPRLGTSATRTSD